MSGYWEGKGGPGALADGFHAWARTLDPDADAAILLDAEHVAFEVERYEAGAIDYATLRKLSGIRLFRYARVEGFTSAAAQRLWALLDGALPRCKVGLPLEVPDGEAY